MRRRLRKQITVVAVVATALVGLLALITLVLYEPPLPPPPPPPTFEPLVVREVRVLRSDTDRLDLFALVKNPNANAGVREVDYTFELRSGDQLAASIPGKTFFLPGQEKPIIEVNRAIAADGRDLTVRFGEPVWVSVASDFRAPALVPVARESRIRPGEPELYEVKGVLANESSLDYLRVEVSALGLDADGELLGAGRTFVGSLLAGERREFTLSWPIPRGGSVSQVRVFPEVNVFSPAAVQLREGTGGLEPRPGVPPSPGL